MSIRIWDASTGRPLATLSGHTKARVEAACWSPDGKRFASLVPGEECGIRIWDAEMWQLRRAIQPEPSMRILAWSPDGQQIAAMGGVRTPVGVVHDFQVWDADTGQGVLPRDETLRKFQSLKHLYPMSVAWSPDGRRLAIGGMDHSPRPNEIARQHYQIVIWDIVGEKKPFIFRTQPYQPLKSLAWHPDGKRLASAGEGSSVRVWETETGRELLVLPGTHSVAWSPDGKLLAAPSSITTRAVKTWDAATGREVYTLRGHRSTPKALGVKRKYFPRERLSTAFFLPDVRTSVAAAAETTPRRSGLVISSRRGTPTTSGRGEPHPTLMRTPAAQPRKAERLCRGTCPGRSRYSYVPSIAAIQKSDWLTLQKERPVRHSWRLGRIVRA